MNHKVSPLAEKANAYYEGLLRTVFADRKFLVAGQVAVAASLGGLARRLTGLGAARPFLIAGSEGTGSLPTPDEAELRVLGIQSTNELDHYRLLRQALEDLPGDLRHDIDAWDPSGTARFIFASPLADSVDAAGRRAYAGRPPAWAALEDKVRIDGFWDAIGVRRAPSRIVAADYSALKSAAKELDRGLGTVWAADAREGTHGGGMGLRWVRQGDDGWGSFASLRRMADRIRVMPFLEGIPASIHGIVFPDSVAVFRPVEMVVLRPTTGDRLHYAGCATTFDPLPDDRKAMRDLANRVGATLRETVGYRGPFGIDGILAEDGYFPTELNARAGGALRRPMAQSGLPLTPMCQAVSQGERLDYRPSLLEQAVIESTDVHRTCAGWSATRLRIEQSLTLDVVRDGDDYREPRPGEDRHGNLQVGPGPVGGFVRFVLDPERIERGRSAALEVVRAFRFADRALGTDFGEFDVAIDVRR